MWNKQGLESGNRLAPLSIFASQGFTIRFSPLEADRKPLAS